jgi:hypothetical protein
MVIGADGESLAMLTRLLFKDGHSFGPEELILLVDAFENAISDMRIDRDAPAALAVAKRIIEAAKQGERDPSRLCDGAIKAIQVGTETRPPT